MKAGVYYVQDARTLYEGDGPPRVTPIAYVSKVGNSLVAKNTIGNGWTKLPWPREHPLFRDDEEKGLVVIPTAQGTVTLQWPDAQVFEELGYGIDEDEWPYPPPADDADRQEFLFNLCCGDGEL